MWIERKYAIVYILRTQERGWNTYQASSAVATVLIGAGKVPEDVQNIRCQSVNGKSSTNYGIFLIMPFDGNLGRQSAYFSKTGKEPLLYSVYSMSVCDGVSSEWCFQGGEATLEKETLLVKAVYLLHCVIALRLWSDYTNMWCLKFPVPAVSVMPQTC